MHGGLAHRRISAQNAQIWTGPYLDGLKPTSAQIGGSAHLHQCPSQINGDGGAGRRSRRGQRETSPARRVAWPAGRRWQAVLAH